MGEERKLAGLSPARRVAMARAADKMARATYTELIDMMREHADSLHGDGYEYAPAALREAALRIEQLLVRG